MAVYVVEAVGIGFIKIGFCGRADVAQRIAGLQTGCPVRIEVLSVVTTFGRDDEAELHSRFQHARSHGEWFRATPEVRAWIATLTPAMKSRAQRAADWQARVDRSRVMCAEDLREALARSIRIGCYTAEMYFGALWGKISDEERDAWRSFLHDSSENARWRKNNPSPYNDAIALRIAI